MRKYWWLLPVSFILYGCPFESKVPLEMSPVEPVDTTLLGYWYGIIKDGSDYFGIEALDITKKSDSVYSIIRYGKAAKGDIILPDTAYFSGYTSFVGGLRFMNIESSVLTVKTRRNKPPEVITERIYYLARVETSHDTLRLKTISEDFMRGQKPVRSPLELRELIIDMGNQQKNIYDDLYSLDYRKWPRPG